MKEIQVQCVRDWRDTRDEKFFGQYMSKIHLWVHIAIVISLPFYRYHNLFLYSIVYGYWVYFQELIVMMLH
jgi:hypothetical protein